MDTSQTLGSDAANVAARNMTTSAMVDSAIGLDDEDVSSSNGAGQTMTRSVGSDSCCFSEAGQTMMTRSAGPDSGCFAEATGGDRASVSENRVRYGNIVRATKEMKTMLNKLRDEKNDQEKKGSANLTAKVFCKDNFVMAIVGEAGCRLFFPDGSLALDIPPGALVRETVIYVYKPINYIDSEKNETEPDSKIRYGPSLICGTEGTTFLHRVTLSCRHYADLDDKNRTLSVRECEKGKLLWKTLPGEDVSFDKKHRTVTVKLPDFCLIEFVDDEDYEAGDVPRKAMAIIFGILRTPTEGSKTQVSLVDCDPCVIAAIENDLKDMGCKQDDIRILQAVPIDPKTEVTFTVVRSKPGDQVIYDDPISIKPSFMRQQASICLDVSSIGTTIAKHIEVRQDEILASFIVPDATFDHHESTTPQQADRCFSFYIPPPLTTEECPVEVRNICEQHGLVVYEGAYRIAESVADDECDTNDGGDTKEATSAASLASFPVQSRRKGSVGVAPSADVPTIQE